MNRFHTSRIISLCRADAALGHVSRTAAAPAVAAATYTITGRGLHGHQGSDGLAIDASGSRAAAGR
jgi:hypothetical protein